MANARLFLSLLSLCASEEPSQVRRLALNVSLMMFLWMESVCGVLKIEFYWSTSDDLIKFYGAIRHFSPLPTRGKASKLVVLRDG